MDKEPANKITQKEAFLKYLERMDIEMLDLILDDSITYFGVSKKTFLEKLSYIFNQVKLCGWKGYLRVKIHKKMNNTYYLPLQICSYVNKFVIEEKDGNITKMYNSKILSNREDIENLSPLIFFFGDDEKADFKPSTEYVMNLHRCTKAYEEFTNNKFQFFTSKDIAQWLKKHALLYEEIKDDYLLFNYNNFKSLFISLEFLDLQLQDFKEAEIALKSFPGANSTDLEQWLADYFTLAYRKGFLFGTNF